MGLYDDVLSPEAEPTRPAAKSAPVGGGTYDDVLAPPPEQPAAPEGKVVYRSSIFPLSRTDQGNVKLDWGSGVIGDIGRAFTLPGRVASGETPMPPLGTRDPNAYNQIVPETLNMGQILGPLNPIVRSGDKVIPGAATNLVRPIREAPSASTLREVGGAQMDQFRDMPIRYDPSHIGTLADTIEGKLIDKGVFREDAKGTYTTLDRMRQSAGPQPAGATAVITPASLHSLRRNIANKFGVQGEHQLAPGIAQGELDQFIKAPPKGAVMAGPTAPGAPLVLGDANALAAQTADLFERARGNLAGSYRGQDIADLAKRIDLKTAAAHSGKNLDNTIRQQVTGLLLDEGRTRGFTTPEKDAFEAAVYGDPFTNRLRTASKILGGGGGLGAAASGSLGAAAGGTAFTALGVPPWMAYPVGAAIPPTLGGRLGAWGAGRTRNAMLDVGEATRRRTPLFQEQPLLPMQAPAAPTRDAIARALMMGASPQAALYPPEEQ